MDNCKVLRLGTRNNESFNYSLCLTSLTHTDSEKELGVVVDSKLRFTKYISENVKRANSIIEVIGRLFWFLKSETVNRLYTGLVCLHIEYAVPVWNPHLKKDKKKIKSVQRRATKQINGQKYMNYEESLKQLKLPVLII